MKFWQIVLSSEKVLAQKAVPYNRLAAGRADFLTFCYGGLSGSPSKHMLSSEMVIIEWLQQSTSLALDMLLYHAVKDMEIKDTEIIVYIWQTELVSENHQS